jgi:hypothetical protein
MSIQNVAVLGNQVSGYHGTALALSLFALSMFFSQRF